MSQHREVSHRSMREGPFVILGFDTPCKGLAVHTELAVQLDSNQFKE